MSNKLIEDEPVLVATAAGAIVNSALTVLATHHIITDAQVSGDTKTFAPIVAFALTALIGLVARRLVTPAKKVEEVLAKSGLLQDVDWGRLEAMLLEHVGGDQAITAAPAPVEADVPDGLNAGAPAVAAPVEPPVVPPVPPTPTA